MKITEVVTPHPAVAKEVEFTNLLHSGEKESDEIIAFIMDDRNAESRRLLMLRHLDEILGDVQDSYNSDSLVDFMNDSGEISPEEADEIAQDMRLPPYHVQLVDETEDDDTPTGEYEICQRCGGEGCIECEEGLKDITGLHKTPDFSKFDDPS
jgi:hypothetical protein